MKEEMVNSREREKQNKTKKNNKKPRKQNQGSFLRIKGDY